MKSKTDTMALPSPAVPSVDTDGLKTDDQTAVEFEIPDAMKKDATPAGYAQRINDHLTHGIVSCVEAGRELIAAKSKLGHGEFQRLFEPGVLRVDQRTAEMLMKIAEHAVLSESNNYSNLPAALNTLYQLSRMPARNLRKAIEKGTVTSTITIREAKALVGTKKGGKPTENAPRATAPQILSDSAVKSDVQTSEAATQPKDLQHFCAESRKQTSEMLSTYPHLAGVLQAHLNSLLQMVMKFRQEKKLEQGKQLGERTVITQPAITN